MTMVVAGLPRHPQLVVARLPVHLQLVVALLLQSCSTPRAGVLSLTPATITVNATQPGFVERDVMLVSAASTPLNVTLRLSITPGAARAPEEAKVPRPPTDTVAAPGDELLPDPVPDPPAPPTLGVRQGGASPCKLLVRLRNKATGHKTRRRLTEDPNLRVKSWRHLDHVGIDLVDLDCLASGHRNVGKSVEYLKGHYHDDIEFVEEDHLVFPTQHPSNDPFWGSLWGMQRIGVPEAWSHLANVGTVTPLTVAVIDTGVQLDHEDLVAALWVNEGEIPGNGIDDDGNGFVDDVHGWDFADNDADPSDPDGHGTHCAGVIAAVADNGVGVVGVAARVPVRIMAVRFLGLWGGSTSDAIAGLDYALANGAKISSNSWGSLSPGGSPSLSQAMRAAADQGHLFVSAAGNEGADVDTNMYTPCALSEDFALCVAATTRNDEVASYSNYGRTKVHIAAPGSSIFSTVNRGEYDNLDGTSMATPHVSGAAALLWATQSHLTMLQVREAVLTSSDRALWLDGYVQKGLLDVGSMMESSRGWLHFRDDVGNLSTSMDLFLEPGETVNFTLAVGFETVALGGSRMLYVVAEADAGREVDSAQVSFHLEGRPEIVHNWGNDTLEIDLGTVFVEGTSSSTATLRNVGNANARIAVRQPQAPFGCSPIAYELQPNAYVDLLITCTPYSAGSWEALIDVASSADELPAYAQHFTLKVRCAGVDSEDSLELNHFSGAMVYADSSGQGRYLQPCIPAEWEPHLAGGKVVGPLALPLLGNLEGCQAHAAGSLEGHVLLVARGTCSFHLKALHAQEAGAVGLLIDDSEALTTLSILPIVSELPLPQIPTFLTSAQQGSRLRLRAATDTVALHWEPVSVWIGHPDHAATSVTLSNPGAMGVVWNSSTYLDFGETQSRFYAARLVAGDPRQNASSGDPRLTTALALCDYGADDALETVELPFKFPFYGQLVDKVSVSSNGYLSFDVSDTRSAYYGSLPSMERPNGLIAPYWTDLTCDSTSKLTVTYEPAEDTEPAVFEIRFENFQFFGGGDEVASFKVDLFATGQINIVILDVPSSRSARIGLETLDGQHGGNYATHLPYSAQPFTIEFIPWLVTLSSSYGVLPGDTNSSIEFMAPGARLGQGWLVVNTHTDAAYGQGGYDSVYRIRVRTQSYQLRWSLGSWGPCDGQQRSRSVACLGSDDQEFSVENCTQQGICLDNPEGWVDSVGNPCSNYSAYAWCTSSGGYGSGWNPLWGTFAQYSTDGHTASTACCACGAGDVLPAASESCGSEGVAVIATTTTSTTATSGVMSATSVTSSTAASSTSSVTSSATTSVTTSVSTTTRTSDIPTFTTSTLLASASTSSALVSGTSNSDTSTTMTQTTQAPTEAAAATTTTVTAGGGDGGEDALPVLVTGSMSLSVGEANAAQFVADPAVKTALKGTIATAAGVTPAEVLSLSLSLEKGSNARRRLDAATADSPHDLARLLQGAVGVAVTYSIQATDTTSGTQAVANLEAYEPGQMSQLVETAVAEVSEPNTYTVQVTSMATPGVTILPPSLCPAATTTEALQQPRLEDSGSQTWSALVALLCLWVH